MKPIADFDLIRFIHLLMKEAAVTDQRVVGSHYYSKLGRQSRSIPGEYFIEHGLRLFACVGTK